MKTFREAIDYIRKKDPALAATFKGAKPEEIRELGEHRIAGWPPELREFFEVMGNGLGGLVLAGFHGGVLKMSMGSLIKPFKPDRHRKKPRKQRLDRRPQGDFILLGYLEGGCQDCGPIEVEGSRSGGTRVVQRDEDYGVNVLAESIGDFVFDGFKKKK